MIIKCPECGHQVSDQAQTCPSCGIAIAGKVTRCPDCGEIIFKEQAECPNCHCTINGALPPSPARVADTPPAQSPTDEEEQPAPKRRRPKAGYIALVVGLVIALIVVFLGIYFYKNVERQNTQRAYDNALMSDQPAVLQNFLDMYPDASIAMRDSIKAHLAVLKKGDLEWANAVTSGSKAELEKYVKLHPNSMHNVEAMLKIDSIDWVTAEKAGTLEALKAYLEQHEDGQHYDEARNLYERIDAQRITPEDKQMVSQLFTAYFTALSQRDEAALTATLAPVLTSFLHRENATKSEVMQYMQKLYEDDITAIQFTPNNDWQLEKREDAEGVYSYDVVFTVDQRIERSDQEKERFATYKVTGRISSEGKISEVNMKRIVQN